MKQKNCLKKGVAGHQPYHPNSYHKKCLMEGRATTPDPSHGTTISIAQSLDGSAFGAQTEPPLPIEKECRLLEMR